jgi:hypothetical protein
MKKIIHIILIISVIFSSCSEFLVQEPDKQVSINEQFSTQVGVNQAINGMYRDIEALISGKYFFYADLIGGNLSFSPKSKDYIIEVPPGMNIEQVYDFRDLEAASDYEGVYTDCYSLINEANLIIERTRELDFLSNEEKNQIKAEALATRVLGHYIVSLLYAQNYKYTSDASHPGIVYNTRTLIAGADYPSRIDMATTYQLMKSDLEEALNLFTQNQALNYGPSYSYFNTITTQALFARIALQMNDWQTAYDLSDLVINNSGIQLMDKDSVIAEWEKPEEPVSEIILEFSAPRDSDEGGVSSSVAHDYFSYISPTIYNEFVASSDLLSLYSINDIRGQLFLQELLKTSVSGVVSDKVYHFTKKFQDQPGTTFIRLSEMYLIRSEAMAQLGTDDVSALADLNTIRQRAGITDLPDATNLLEEIFLERRRELAFEGHLLFDIARYKKDIVRGSDCISSTCSLSYPSDYYILPIPASSVTLNENIIQNEGY